MQDLGGRGEPVASDEWQPSSPSWSIVRFVIVTEEVDDVFYYFLREDWDESHG